MDPEVRQYFDWVESAVFVATLMISTCIGVFFCFHGGGQNTVSGYFLGNKKMSVFPVTMSLIASSVSGLTLLGQPTEIYFHGAQYVLVIVANIIICSVNITIFLPVFYNLQVISLNEYLEMRFDRKVRTLASLFYVISALFFIPVVIYGPALAINQVSGLSVHLVALVLCVVCIFYTTVGGLKAVVWADALQGSVMIFSLIVVLITGLVRVGGFGAVFSAAYNHQRLDILNFSTDPTERLNFWSATVGLTFLWLAYGCVNPTMVQRYVSLPTIQHAKKSAVYQWIGMSTFSLLSIFLGLIVFAHYQTCDPLSSKLISRPDQIIPFFVLDVVKHVKGLPGLFVAGIVSAALSTMSTSINTLGGTVYEDFIEPIIGRKSEKTASSLMKLLSVIIGIISTSLIMVVERMGNLVDLISKLGGITCGAILGIFTMGLLIPQTNANGAFYGGILGFLFMLWTTIGHELSGSVKCLPKKPLSVSSCVNSTLNILEVTCPVVSDTFKAVFPTHAITVFYYGLMGLAVSLCCGVIISYLTGANEASSVDSKLLSPVTKPFIKRTKAQYSSVDLKVIKPALQSTD